MKPEYTRAHHFTKAVHAVEDLRKKRVKISVFDAVNDPNELHAYVLEGLQEIDGAEPVNQFMVKSFIDHYCLLCLGPNSFNPILWDRYAESSRGVCLGLDIKTSLIRPIDYVDKVKVGFFPADLRRTLLSKPIPAAKRSSRALIKAARFFEPYITTKFRTFTDKDGAVVDSFREEELNAFVTKDEEEDGRYFSAFCKTVRLKEVILGELCELSEEWIISLVKDYSYQPVRVRRQKGATTITQVAHSLRRCGRPKQSSS